MKLSFNKQSEFKSFVHDVSYCESTQTFPVKKRMVCKVITLRSYFYQRLLSSTKHRHKMK